MAKSKGKKNKKKDDAGKSTRSGARKKKSSSSGQGPLGPALDTFSKGDYVTSKKMFEGHVEDPELSEENRHVAKALLQSIGIDRGTLMVGLACIGLYLLVILVGYLKQP